MIITKSDTKFINRKAFKNIDLGYYIYRIIKSKLFLLMIMLFILCIPVHAEETLSMDEAMDIILEYHNVETEIDVSYYLTLDAETFTREAAVTAVVRSYGIYPADEPDYIWLDEDDQGDVYRSYIDYARRMGITNGVREGYFAPKQATTEWMLRTMLERAESIEPEYNLFYDSPISKLLSSNIQYGLSLVPNFLLNMFYAENRQINVTTSPIILDNGFTTPYQYAGYIQYEGDIWLVVDGYGYPYNRQDRTAIHELGHFLGYRTKLLNRNAIPEELDWIMHRYRKYCNRNNQEFFADSFVVYILWPDEMEINAPTMFLHIQKCLEELGSRYK